jgi:P-type Ca2+ transporter type 2C
MSTWYKLDSGEALQELATSGQAGLSDEEVRQRLATHGPNELIEHGGRSPWRILWEQFTATMVVILIVAGVISALLGEFKDASAIFAIVVLYALLGFSQEYRAEKAMAALKKLAVPTVRVRRNGQVREMSARELVPGDILLLEAGNVVPADSRLIEVANLRVQESALTGESEAVEKEVGRLERNDLAPGDQRNMVFMGTIVTYGRGSALVVETGMQTELGRIATMLQSVEHELTPLQRRLDQLGRMVAVLAIAVAAVIFLLGLLRGEELELMFLTAVSIAVAIVPEGLPAVVTITLALGARRMLARQALIRKLPAVETLGSVTVICSDKTGTLTENRMTVVVVDVAGQRITLEPGGEVRGLPANGVSWPVDRQELALLLAGSALCNDALLQPASSGGDGLHPLGDPTETALVVAAARYGLWKGELEECFPRVEELPFDSERKRMTTVHESLETQGLVPSAVDGLFSLNGGSAHPYVAFTKGAVDGLLSISTHIAHQGHLEPLTDRWRARIQEAHDGLAAQGMRVLGLATRLVEPPLPVNGARGNLTETLEQELTFVGLVGMIDPPRPEVQQAVARCRTAGIRPIMITGDHPLTALHIAHELGIEHGERLITGQELASMTDEALERVVDEVNVYARVSPEHKLRIVQALQQRGQIVAMTGDGVNDAPALKKADIGVAMGITGTDVSKEAADMVLRDDNFATIVAAVEEGRTIYDNIRKFIKFSLAGNIGKVLVMLLAPFLNMPLPLLPLQLLWLNLLTDGLLGLGLGVEPAERASMQRPPHSPHANILGAGLGKHIVWMGLLIGLLALAAGFGLWQTGEQSWQSMIFTTLAFAQVWQALAIRSGKESLFQVGLFSNRLLLGTATATVLLQLLVIYLPFLQEFFQTVPLTLLELLLAVGVSSVVFIAVETEKWLLRRRSSQGEMVTA